MQVKRWKSGEVYSDDYKRKEEISKNKNVYYNSMRLEEEGEQEFIDNWLDMHTSLSASNTIAKEFEVQILKKKSI